MHPIKHPKIVEINQTRICVSVQRKGKQLVQSPDLMFAKPNTVWAHLPKSYKVLDQNGNEIPGSFLITLETIDPYHLITHYEDSCNR